MKKRIFILCTFLIGCLFVKNVCAKEFKEEKNYPAKFDIYIPLNKYHLIKNFVKITDNENPLYEISPTRTFFTSCDDYKEVLTSLDNESLSKIFKIMYFGYGYKNQNTDKFYFATQYLIYKTFSTIDVTYVGEEKDFFQDEMDRIEKNMVEVSFSLKDLEITEPVYELKDKYIIDNFNIEGDSVKFEKEKNKVIFHFLEEKEDYELHFVPKNNCENTTAWTTHATELLPRGNVCEKEYIIKVHSKKPKEETIEKEEPKEDKNEKEEEKTTNINIDTDNEYVVSVPATGKNGFFIWYSFLVLGIGYYVFKK